jgi:hypothetical protein
LSCMMIASSVLMFSPRNKGAARTRFSFIAMSSNELFYLHLICTEYLGVAPPVTPNCWFFCFIHLLFALSTTKLLHLVHDNDGPHWFVNNVCKKRCHLILRNPKQVLLNNVY